MAESLTHALNNALQNARDRIDSRAEEKLNRTVNLAILEAGISAKSDLTKQLVSAGSHVTVNNIPTATDASGNH
ncbi:hypothetical protein [Zhongshania sp.]|uniref:hypothetical protein n=1 Tax=Zhongshania sp. TaxID=1971902 RepID=UPI003564449E